jgi:predicted MPP superfamily phosphohydrolase
VNFREEDQQPATASALNRRNALRLIAAGALGGGASLAHACWIEPDLLTISRRDVGGKNLPPAIDGLRVGLLADLHFRPGSDDELLEKVVATVKTERLDLIALAGDYMGDDPQVVTPMLSRLKTVTAAHGIFAVMGNHDGWSGNPAVIRREFEKAGISFLINQHTILSIRGESLAIAGTDFVWEGKPDAAKTLAGISPDTPVVALVHEPDYFHTMTAQREIMLQVSGHTHGGQCRVPFIGYAPRRVRFGRNYLYGHYVRGDSNLFVSRGVGTTGPRVRFACPPELAILTLKAHV